MPLSLSGSLSFGPSESLSDGFAGEDDKGQCQQTKKVSERSSAESIVSFSEDVGWKKRNKASIKSDPPRKKEERARSRCERRWYFGVLIPAHYYRVGVSSWKYQNAVIPNTVASEPRTAIKSRSL